MAEERARLARECRVFTRNLLSAAPTDYIAERYAAAHAQQPRLRREAAGTFDRLVVDTAALHPALARLADSYCWLAARRSLLRRKLFLLAAILESAAPMHRRFWHEGRRGAVRAWTDLVYAGVRASVVLVFAILLFAPVHLAVAGADRARRAVGRHAPAADGP